jgi:hypothetical protein
MKKTLFALILICQISWGQHPIDFDNEDYYFLKRSHHLKIELVEQKLKIENEVFEKAKFNNGKMLYLFGSGEYIHFDSFTEIENIDAFTETSSGIIKVDHFETKDQFGGGVFFSDQQSINFVFPAVGKDAVTTLRYKEIIEDPHFLGSFRFGTYVPTKEAVYTIEVPKGVELGYKTFNLDSIDITYEKIENKKNTLYSWKANNIKQFRKSEESLSVLNYLPHIIVHIKNYTVKRKTISVLNDVSDLYAWYHSLTSQVDETNIAEVHAIADKIVDGLSSNKEKAKVIFNWVQSHINYVAFEDGLGGFIPRGSFSVCTKKYGDCKDMANLLYVMLNHVGVEAYHTWIGTRDRPYSYYEVPTPVVDNHMITAAIIDGTTIFLDATDSYVPFGMPSSFIQGKEALLGISKDEYRIIKVPVQEKEINHTVIKTSVSIKRDTVRATSTRIMKGYDMVDFIFDAKFKKDEKTDAEYLNSKYEIGNNKTTFSNIDLGDLNSLNDSYSIKYDLDIFNYSRTIGSKIFLNLTLEKTLAKDIILSENHPFGKKIDHKFVRDYSTTFVIPEGYQLKSIPENTDNELEDYGFSFKYNLKDNKLTVDQQIYMNTLAIKNEQFENYNIFIKSLLKVYKKSIVLEKIQ